jgi:molecular chaperone HtpG
MSHTASKETLGFQAEVTELLHLMVHSLYGNKEIFLRELVSNASDACDKLRFESLSNSALLESDPAFRIRVTFDRDARTITISDNGIGMSRQEVIENIGTIARSGTREFVRKLTADAAKDAQLIGQFGVGFYSSFIVADRVTIETRRAGAPASEGVRWESRGEGQFTIESIERAARGTDIVLHLREGEDELLDGSRLRGILRRYSDHITVPILMKKETWDTEKKARVTTDDDEQVNQASALWSRPKSEITDEQYHEFYKHVAHDFDEPLAWVHAHVEGRQEYTQLFFIPKQAPYDIWDRNDRHGIKLYIRRVFIMDDAEHLLPAYLRFVRGIIDSNDLPLNVSREILQQSQDVTLLRNASVKRVLGLLEDLATREPEKYAAFWKEFGRVLKEGIVDDFGNRERLAKLLRFSSTHDDSEVQATSLTDYVGRMKDGQKDIYYLTADGFAAARYSPHLERFRKLGLEVLLLSDRIDEWVVASLTEFDGKRLQSITQADLDLSAFEQPEEKEAEQRQQTELQGVLERIKAVLKDRASDVRISRRLTDSPACIVSGAPGMSTNLERILKSAGQSVPSSRPVLEINPDHPLIQRFRDEANEELFADWSHVLFDQATLAEGGQLEDPASFVRRLNALTLALAGAGPSRIWTPS